MPGKKIRYEQRKIIEQMCKQGKKATEIAEALGINRATIYLEVKRGGTTWENREQYSAARAQEQR